MLKNNSLQNKKLIDLAKLSSNNKSAQKGSPGNSLPNIIYSADAFAGSKKSLISPNVSKQDDSPSFKLKNLRMSTLHVSQQKWSSVRLDNSLSQYRDAKQGSSEVAKTVGLTRKYDQSRQQASVSQESGDSLDIRSGEPARQKKFKASFHKSMHKSASRLEQLFQTEARINVKLKEDHSPLSQIFGSGVKFADAKVGPVRGYAASSQLGNMSPLNTVRIAVALNILKTAVKSR